LQYTVYLFEGFQLDVTRRKLISAGGLVQPLNSRATEALLLLVENAGELVDKRRLMETVWPNSVVEDNNLNQCILAIRKALGETAGSNRFVMTVPGRGYRFVTPVRTVLRESGNDTPVRMPPGAWWTAAAAGLFTLSLLLLLVTLYERPVAQVDCSGSVAAVIAASQ
jgi:DNA-binding winged helix-turn-helix (wHTH) protein